VYVKECNQQSNEWKDDKKEKAMTDWGEGPTEGMPSWDALCGS
jgi:hypothetical protein